MATTNIALGSSTTLLNESTNMLDEIDYFNKIIDDIYNTYDDLKKSWTGEKSKEFKAILEEVREPLKNMCCLSTRESEKLRKVGQITSDYSRK